MAIRNVLSVGVVMTVLIGMSSCTRYRYQEDDDTFTDTVANLMFTKDVFGTVDTVKGESSYGVTSLAQAEDLCTKLRVGGYSDWRVPADGDMSAGFVASQIGNKQSLWRKPVVAPGVRVADATIGKIGGKPCSWSSNVQNYSGSASRCSTDAYIGGAGGLTDFVPPYTHPVRCVRNAEAVGFGAYGVWSQSEAPQEIR